MVLKEPRTAGVLVRLSDSEKTKLDALCSKRMWSMQTMLVQLIREEWKREFEGKQ